jgi:hypothetical protein
MSSDAPDRHGLLHPESSDLSEASAAIGSDTRAVAPFQRMGHSNSKIDGIDEISDQDSPSGEDEPEVGGAAPVRQQDRNIFGLDIGTRPTSIERVPVGAKNSSQVSESAAFGSLPGTTPRSAGFGHPLLSPKWAPPEPRYDNTGYFGTPAASYETSPEITQGGGAGMRGGASYGSNLGHSFTQGDEHFVRSFQSTKGPPHGQGCPANHDIHEKRGSWLSICLLVLSVYSTLWSGLWFVTAILRPRWGQTIASGGPLAPSTASLLIALFAKTIELSFVTVFVGFIGQVLSRRSFVKHSRGISLAEMEMRQWIIQPGSLLTHGQTLRYAGWSIIGVVSLIATLVSMLYTTASDAMISPTLQFGRWENREMQSLVRSSYANPTFVAQTCERLILDDEDPEYAGTTCLALEHAGQGNIRNFMISPRC